MDERGPLSAAIADLRRRFGREAIFCMADQPPNGVSVIPTGSIALDYALGPGGVPRGRITEIFGPEGTGKTTLALSIAAQAQQRMGAVVAFIDMEHSLDWEYAHTLGIHPGTFFLAQPETGEQAWEITEALIRSGEVMVVVIDSVAALVPRAEVEGKMGDSHAGLQARLMSQAMRKLICPLRQSQAALILTNQLRHRIGVMFGNSETTPGGRALRFHTSVRLRIQQLDAVKSNGQIVGSWIRATVRKNKVAPPFRTAEFVLLYEQGFLPIDLVETGVNLEIIQEVREEKEEGFFYEASNLGHSKRQAANTLLQDPDMARRIERRIRARLWPNGHRPQ